MARAHLEISHGYLKRHAKPEYDGIRNYLNKQNIERPEYWVKAIQTGKIKPLTTKAKARLELFSTHKTTVLFIDARMKRRLQ